MLIKDANLDIIATRRSQYPDDNRPEFLLVGRSNVGKSSFINSILSRKNLAHTSATPGKTQTLNFYGVNDSFYLIDVPGYGYAATDKKTQFKFGMMIEEYLENREFLKRVYMLVDFRIKPTQDDLLMYNFLKYHNLPVTVVATKVDKVSKNERDKQISLINSELNLVETDRLVLFSNKTKLGKSDIQKEIEDIVYKEEK